jgi:hypothetical protein
MPVSRETYETVKRAQVKLLKLFLEMERNSDTVGQDEETLETFLGLTSDSFVGIERGYSFFLEWNNEVYECANLTVLIKDLTFFVPKDPAKKTFPMKLKGYPNLVEVPLSDVWKSVRRSCYRPMADAITLAFTTSSESFSTSLSAFEFGLDTIKDHRQKLAKDMGYTK